MKLPHFAKLSRGVLLGLVVTLAAGCATTSPKSSCPPKYSYHYADSARGFSLCLPAGLQKTDSSASVVFAGFAVPQGTNLQAKTLVVVSGNYDFLQGARPAGQ